MRPELIIVEIERGPQGGYYAGSRDLKGLHVLENSRDALLAEIPRVIEELMAANNKSVSAKPIDFASDKYVIFVAVPAHGDLDLCA